MNKRRHNYSAVLIFSLGALFGVGNRAQAQVRISGWAVSANGQPLPSGQYFGSCPVTLKFGWAYFSDASSDKPTMVTWSYTRSDGFHPSSPSTISVPYGRSTDVDVSWTLGANTPEFANYRGWADLKTESPVQVSQRIPVVLHCSASGPPAAPKGFGKIRIEQQLLESRGEPVPKFTYTGPCPADLTFGWKVTGTEATPVTYWINRSDGFQSSERKTVNIPADTKEVIIREEWRVPAQPPKFRNYFQPWVQLNIETPNPDSLRINPLVACQK